MANGKLGLNQWGFLVGRLKAELLDRVEAFCDRVLDVSDALAEQSRSRRIVDQLVGCGSSVGANVFEADEALSPADFCRCLGIATKELNETRFWVRLIGRRDWIISGRLTDLQQEAVELKRIFGAIIARTRKTVHD